MFVGLEITAQSFQTTPTRHYPALALAALVYLITIPLNGVLGANAPAPYAAPIMQTLRCLANGFLITGLLWTASLASEQIGLPYDVLLLVQQQPGGVDFWKAVQFQTPYHWATAYGLSAPMLWGCRGSKQRERRGFYDRFQEND